MPTDDAILGRIRRLVTDLIDELRAFAGWQAKLIEQLKIEVNSSMNWDDPFRIIGRKKKTIELDGETWVLRRHGIGCCFKRTTDGLEVDALKYLGSAPSSFEAWSIETFLESKGVRNFIFRGDEYAVGFSEIDTCLSRMEAEGELKPIDKYRVFELVS